MISSIAKTASAWMLRRNPTTVSSWTATAPIIKRPSSPSSLTSHLSARPWSMRSLLTWCVPNQSLLSSRSAITGLASLPSAVTSTLGLVRAKHTLKTNKSVAKRFRVRGNGTLVRYVTINLEIKKAIPFLARGDPQFHLTFFFFYFPSRSLYFLQEKGGNVPQYGIQDTGSEKSIGTIHHRQRYQDASKTQTMFGCIIG